jgi:hypothetical protein
MAKLWRDYSCCCIMLHALIYWAGFNANVNIALTGTPGGFVWSSTSSNVNASAGGILYLDAYPIT